MSVSADLTLRFVSGQALEAGLVALLRGGWAWRAEGAEVVPLGAEVSDWETFHPVDSERLVALLRSKTAAAETFGIRLYWQGRESGGEFLLFASGELSFSPSIERVTLPQSRATDASWYLARILPCFAADGSFLESWTWSETS